MKGTSGRRCGYHGYASSRRSFLHRNAKLTPAGRRLLVGVRETGAGSLGSRRVVLSREGTGPIRASSLTLIERQTVTDRLSPEARSRLMSRIGSKDTLIERPLRSALHVRGFRFRKHVRGLPGTPDIVFPRLKVAVFVDGDFWHGYRFPAWKHTLAPAWQAKIEGNRARDRRVHAKLRRWGWVVVRVWGHEIASCLEAVVARLISVLTTASRAIAPGGRPR